MEHQGAVTLVTGTSSGFGLLAAVELARAGFRVFATMRDLARGARLEQAAAEAGVTLDVVPLDVCDESSIGEAIAEIGRRAGPVEVLVNNAGFGLAGFLEDLEMSELREQLETNFFGAVAVIKAVLPGMRERRAGRIINVSSVDGRIALPALSAYCASKWALEGLSESLRLEVRPFGVHVVLVEPGTYRTDAFERNRRVGKRALDPASAYHERARRIEAAVDTLLAESTADPRDVARLIVRAATVRRPRLRYLVGRDAHVEATLRSVLPFGLWERVLWGSLDRMARRGHR